MQQRWTSGLVVALLLFVGVTTAAALPIISIDLDGGPGGTAGIQSTLTVDPGSSFTIDVVIADAAIVPAFFDTVILEPFFNDAGAVLSPGPTLATWGAFAGGSLDLFGGFVPAVPGALAGVGPSGAPAGGFASGSGAVGLLGFFVAPAVPTVIFSIDFTALASGTSTILAAGSPFGSPELALGGGPVFATLASGTVTVTPEPGTWLLMGSGLVGLAGLAWRRRQHA